MANPKQTWARDPETGAGEPGHPTNGDSSSAQYADTDRFGKTVVGDTTPINMPSIMLASSPLGQQAPVG